MIVRIVKMTFQPEKVKEFLEIFQGSQHLIRSFEGCGHLELLRDVQEKHVYFTYSFWESEDHLRAYRSSPLFNEVWDRTKVLFLSRAEAWSLEQRVIL